MSNETYRVVNERPTSHVRTIMSDNNRNALRIEAQGLLDMQTDLTMARRGFTHEQASIIKQSVAEGALKFDGLREIAVEDLAGRRAIHFIGDDDGATWHQFMNPLMVGRFAEPSGFSEPARWWQR